MRGGRILRCDLLSLLKMGKLQGWPVSANLWLIEHGRDWYTVTVGQPREKNVVVVDEPLIGGTWLNIFG